MVPQKPEESLVKAIQEPLGGYKNLCNPKDLERLKGIWKASPETSMKPRKESALETPKKEDPHRITVTSAKREGVEAEEQVADDVVQADRVPELAAVVVASCDAGSVGGMVSEAAWHYKQVSKKPLKELRGAASKQGGSQFAGGSVDATTEREETPVKGRVRKRSEQGQGSEERVETPDKNDLPEEDLAPYVDWAVGKLEGDEGVGYERLRTLLQEEHGKIAATGTLRQWFTRVQAA